MSNRIPSLDGFRAISIILVVFSHCRFFKDFPAYLFDFARQCDVGVTVFFVISGYLITSLLIREYKNTGKINIKAFFIRRAFRIIPVFFLYVCFVLSVNNSLQLGVTTTNFLYAITFTANFDPMPSWYLGHFWTLSIEEQFYLFWPAFFFLFNKNIKLIVVLLILYSCIIRVIVYKFHPDTLFVLYGFFVKSDAIMIGALAALLNLKRLPFFLKKTMVNYSLQIVAILLIALFVYSSAHGKLGIIALPFGNTIVSISIMYLLLSYVEPKENYLFKILNSKIFIHIGVLSYSIYIWQQFFIFQNIHFLNRFPYNLLTIYVISFISYNLWEKPFLKLKDKFISRYNLAGVTVKHKVG
ncbi:acyltransferase [Pedobacter miscanthi]|uniref:acyltransferase family protein n=1 Tax=Pedobacter miscanthi TaxID=2259170 RepID=UPI00292DCE76|nr:acyltransferase [Pedobacter miscanthi]